MDDKKLARATIFKMEAIDNATRWQLLKACTLESELLGIKCVLLQQLRAASPSESWQTLSGKTTGAFPKRRAPCVRAEKCGQEPSGSGVIAESPLIRSPLSAKFAMRWDL